MKQKMLRITEEDDAALNDLIARLVENLSKEHGGYAELMAKGAELPSSSTVLRVLIRTFYRVVRGEHMPTREELLRRFYTQGFMSGPKQRNLTPSQRDRRQEPAYTEPYLPPDMRGNGRWD